MLFYEKDGEYYIFSSNTDKKTMHPHPDEKIQIPCTGVISISGNLLKKDIYFKAEESFGGLEISIISKRDALK